MRHRTFFVLPLLLALLSCETLAPAPRPSRVLLLSLDGADAATLHRLHREGKLAAGGFERFFREGRVAEALVPVNPTITAPNHISLATGYPAGDTGIVGNWLRPPGMPLTRKVNGFAAAIETETLWEAARRQGRRVAAVGWPGTDGKGERRKGDWGMIYTGSPERPAELRTFPPGAWTGTPREGAWSFVPCDPSLAEPASHCWAKVLKQGPAGTLVYLGGEYALQAYPPEFEAALRDLGLTWTGAPDSDLLEETWAGRPGIDLATWVEQAERFSTFFMDALLAAARYSDWDLLMAYTPVIDEAGHQLLIVDPRQPGFSPERRREFEAASLRVWQSVDRELDRVLRSLDLSTTAVLVVSDHGMTPAHTRLDADALLRDWGFAAYGPDGKTALEDSRVDSIGGGGFCKIYLRPGIPEREMLLEDLRDRFASWSQQHGRPLARILTRAEAAEIGMSHPNLGDLLLIAEPGYTFRDEDDPVAPAAISATTVYGKHGYLNTHPAMRAIYLAVGAGVRKGRAEKVSTLEVAPRVADWLGIEKPRPRPVSSY